jgi:alpha-tubulin suppressor-like RCC1 family protein
MGWNDPAQLTSGLIADFRTASHGVANYQLVETVLRDWSPQNGGQYTYQTWLEDYPWTRNTCRFSYPAPYETIISENNLAQRVQAGEIDEVWMWGYPCGNWYESRMTGSGAYEVNAPPLTSVSGRPFILMGYNFERGLAEAAESYGHRAESIVRRVYGFDSWQPNEAHDWNKFTLLDRDVPGRGGIGNAHNAFNAEPDSDYNRTSLRTVSTSADDWANFPNLTGARRDANCTEWNCDGYQYLLWWYSHMPHMVGSTSGVLNDWWQYILRPGEAVPCSDPQRGCRETAPTQLAFSVQPTTTTAGATITPAVQVAARDAQGNTDTRYTGSVTVAIGTNPSGGTLSGTTTVAAVAGVATFGNLSINNAGTGYTLTAAASGLTGATSAAFTITPPPAGLTFAAVDAGGFHTCGVTTSGAAYCWGSNVFGQFGDGTTTDRTTPVLVSGGLTFAVVSAGPHHTCGVTTSGVAYCWGDNFWGQLGDGNHGRGRNTPGLVSGGLTFAAVSAGGDHTCGVTMNGVAYCWGRNLEGQLGDGTTTFRATPGLVSGGLTFAVVSAGTTYTCGVTTSGVAYCWGYNGFGQLGDGTTTFRTAPVLVSGGLTFAAVNAGGGHTCGVTTSDVAYCWGWNLLGQLGDGTTADGTTPGLVSGGLTFAAVSAGTGIGHTCGVTTSGVAYCWGYNVYGQLGDGTTADRTTPVLVSGGLTFAAVDAGVQRTCGVTTSGVAYCWGRNLHGALGDGTQIDRLVPVPVVQ